MGQAATASPASRNEDLAGLKHNADDLLSQMAGDEIDRLLASAHTDGIAPPELSPDANAQLDELMPGLPEAQLESPPLTANTSAPPPPAESLVLPGATPAPAAETSPAVSEVQRDLDNLFNKQPPADTAVTVEVAIAGTAPALASPVSPATDAVLVTADASLDQSGTTAQAKPTVAAASGGVAAPDSSQEIASAASAAETVSAVLDAALASHSPSSSPGVLVKCLEVLNSPLALVPDELREAFGKIAIVTLVNAVAVLVYVLFFRR